MSKNQPGAAFFRPTSKIHGIAMPQALLPEGDEHADTVTIPVTPVAAPVEPVFTREDIEKARQQEKDKVYGRVDAAEKLARENAEALAKIQAERDGQIAAAQAEARKEAEEAARKEWEEKGAKELLAQTNQQWENRFNQFQTERDQERAAFVKEQEFRDLQSYAQQAVSAAVQANHVAPELADFVTGNNREEIDASLENVKQRTQLLVNNMRQAVAQQRATMPGVAPTGAAPVGPLETEGSTRTLTAQDIANMPMAEYAKNRGALLGTASQAQQGRGLYG